jgi:hypothetical protein
MKIMTRIETAAVLAVIKTAYPRYYDNKTKKELEETISLWQTMLEEYPAAVVTGAVKALIAVNKFPPAIAEVIEMIGTLTKPGELGEIEAWGLVKNAIRNSTYHSIEEFEKLPVAIQTTLGSPSVLKEWAMSEDGSVETVVASNFMRSYRSKVDNRKTIEAVPAGVKALIAEANVKMIGGTKNAQ